MYWGREKKSSFLIGFIDNWCSRFFPLNTRQWSVSFLEHNLGFFLSETHKKLLHLLLFFSVVLLYKDAFFQPKLSLLTLKVSEDAICWAVIVFENKSQENDLFSFQTISNCAMLYYLYNFLSKRGCGPFLFYYFANCKLGDGNFQDRLKGNVKREQKLCRKCFCWDKVCSFDASVCHDSLTNKKGSIATRGN